MYLLAHKEFDCFSSLETMMRDVLSDDREQIVWWLEMNRPSLKGQILNDYENGIDDWWYPNGLIMQGLGIIMDLRIEQKKVTLAFYIKE
jgi:hypothetical protein